MDTYVRERTQIHDRAAFEKALEGRRKVKPNICKQTNALCIRRSYRLECERETLPIFDLLVALYQKNSQFFDGTFKFYKCFTHTRTHLNSIPLGFWLCCSCLLHCFNVEQTVEYSDTADSGENVVEDSLNVINDTTQRSQSHTQVQNCIL